MRKAINDNPMVQIGVIGLLVVVVGFFLLTQMGKGSSTSSTSSTAASVAPDASATPSDSSATATTPPASTATTPSVSAPSTTPAAPAGSAAAPAAAGEFVAGPGLPRPVVQAYNADKVVVLLVVRRGGIDDDAVKASVERMSGLPDTAVFLTNAGHVSRYSRIASGVDLDRVPALIVLRPQKLTHGTPTATVSYGFRGPASVAQAIADAVYNGPTNVPYYPK
jgi:hypothetical protein